MKISRSIKIWILECQNSKLEVGNSEFRCSKLWISTFQIWNSRVQDFINFKFSIINNIRTSMLQPLKVQLSTLNFFKFKPWIQNLKIWSSNFEFWSFNQSLKFWIWIWKISRSKVEFKNNYFKVSHLENQTSRLLHSNIETWRLKFSKLQKSKFETLIITTSNLKVNSWNLEFEIWNFKIKIIKLRYSHLKLQKPDFLSFQKF